MKAAVLIADTPIFGTNEEPSFVLATNVGEAVRTVRVPMMLKSGLGSLAFSLVYETPAVSVFREDESNEPLEDGPWTQPEPERRSRGHLRAIDGGKHA